MNGYVILPCFTVKINEQMRDVVFTCNIFFAWVFENFFACFWNGKVWIVDDGETNE